MVCDGIDDFSKQVSKAFFVSAGYLVEMTLSLDSTNQETWDESLQETFIMEVASDLGIDSTESER